VTAVTSFEADETALRAPFKMLRNLLQAIIKAAGGKF
jgi:hypothetical protein